MVLPLPLLGPGEARAFAPLLLLLIVLPVSKAGWQPYQEWYPYFAQHILPQFEGKCDAEISIPQNVSGWCQTGATCIFNNINAYTQAELAGAMVMLGLTPATLAVVGPSDTSLAFLSSERPLLSLLLASSTATLSVGYPFSFMKPLEPLFKALDTAWSIDNLLPRDLMNHSWFISPLQYFLAAAATANTVQMSYDITRKSIVSWSCPNWGWVLCYTFVPTILHALNIFIFRHTVKREPREQSTTSPDDRLFRRFGRFLLENEFRPCCRRVLPRYEIRYSVESQLLWWTPRVMSYLQYLMGVAIFSSLLFISISDAFPIIVRYGISGALARCLVGMELLALKRRNRTSHAEYIESPREQSDFESNTQRLVVAVEETKPVGSP
jgi:hypothetical protein